MMSPKIGLVVFILVDKKVCGLSLEFVFDRGHLIIIINFQNSLPYKVVQNP